MRKENLTQRAYLVRCWVERESTIGGNPLWRFSVEEVLRARRRLGFGDLAGLLTFLRDELSGGAEDEEFKNRNS